LANTYWREKFYFFYPLSGLPWWQTIPYIQIYYCANQLAGGGGALSLFSALLHAVDTSRLIGKAHDHFRIFPAGMLTHQCVKVVIPLSSHMRAVIFRRNRRVARTGERDNYFKKKHSSFWPQPEKRTATTNPHPNGCLTKRMYQFNKIDFSMLFSGVAVVVAY
jgi:hypothetical protein